VLASTSSLETASVARSRAGVKVAAAPRAMAAFCSCQMRPAPRARRTSARSSVPASCTPLSKSPCVVRCTRAVPWAVRPPRSTNWPIFSVVSVRSRSASSVKASSRPAALTEPNGAVTWRLLTRTARRIARASMGGAPAAGRSRSTLAATCTCLRATTLSPRLPLRSFTSADRSNDAVFSLERTSTVAASWPESRVMSFCMPSVFGSIAASGARLTPRPAVRLPVGGSPRAEASVRSPRACALAKGLSRLNSEIVSLLPA
jgi:hypothetical protein